VSDPLPSYHASPSKPKLRLPPLACDAHVHVFGPAREFPFAPDSPFIPADAPKEKLFALHRMLGIERCVVVQSTCHGYDNSVTADAIAAKRGSYLGVALVPADVSDAELRRLDAQGFRGARFNFMKHLGRSAPIDEVIALGARLAPLGWHLQIHFESSLIGAERSSRQGPPYADALPFARKLVAEFGDRVLWGSDWPHPNLAGEIPDDGLLVDLIAEIAPSEAQRRALLVDNPQRLYRFQEPRR
jgi:2-pyrone-4,6-dicarboxylate lactonase